MIYYTFFAMLVLVINFLNLSNYYKCIGICFLALIISCLRFDVGVDYPIHLEKFEIINGLKVVNYEDVSGIAFFSLSKFYFTIFGEHGGVYLLSSIALKNIMLLFLILKNLNYSLNFVNIFIFFPHFFLQSFNLIRQYTAILLCWLFIVYLINNRKKIYLLFFSVLCHYSALVFLPFYFFVFMKKKSSYFIFFVFGIISLFIFIMFFDRFAVYFVSDKLDYNYNLLFILLFIATMTFFSKKFFSNNFPISYIRKLIAISIIIFSLSFYFKALDHILYRTFYYYSFFIPFVFVENYLNFFNRIISLSIRFFMPFIFIVFIFFKGDEYDLLPYKTIFENI